MRPEDGLTRTLSLAEACGELGLNQQQLAQRLGLCTATLKYLDRPNPPAYLRLALAALVTDIDPELVFGTRG
ncbi:hypothetical protein [Phyllobacterium sp. K27]